MGQYTHVSVFLWAASFNLKAIQSASLIIHEVMPLNNITPLMLLIPSGPIPHVSLFHLCLPLMTSYFCSHYLSPLSLFLSSSFSASSIFIISIVLFTHSPRSIAPVTLLQLSLAPAAQFTSRFLILFLFISQHFSLSVGPAGTQAVSLTLLTF